MLFEHGVAPAMVFMRVCNNYFDWEGSAQMLWNLHLRVIRHSSALAIV
jgi:hypothetical protein